MNLGSKPELLHASAVELCFGQLFYGSWSAAGIDDDDFIAQNPKIEQIVVAEVMSIRARV